MNGHQIVNESQLDAWVRGNPAAAQGEIVNLVWRLVCTSCPKPKRRRFPLGDSIGQHGADGKLETTLGFEPFVPEGKSIWEIGTGVNAKQKAEDDYNDMTERTREAVRKKSTFIFVTPLSGRRDWRDTWKADGIASWIMEKKNRNEWKDVRVLDGSQLVDWVSQFPCVGHWLGGIVNQLPDDFDTAESHWEVLSSYGAPPPLLPDLFTVGRDSALERLRRLIVNQNDIQLIFHTRHPEYSKNLVSAFIASLDEKERVEYQNKVMILQSPKNFRQACSISESHVFILDFDLDTNSAPELIQRALSRRHAVIYSSPQGGVPHGNSCELHLPDTYEMQKALIKSGYSEERARILTNYSGRDLNALLRLLQGLSAIPEWATQSEANDLAIAQFISQWREDCEGDQEIIENFSGKAYGEWIINIQRAFSALAAPLEFYKGHWKFTSRYEPWVYLGKFISSQALNRFEQLATTVLSELDPSLDLPQYQRFAAGVLGKEQQYSQQLRKGISETLALLGAQGEHLSLCSQGDRRRTAEQVVNNLLEKADSKSWASLNDVLPFLAEAAPDVFLKIVSEASEKPNGPFSGVFAEEGDDWLGGRCYMTGLLWALESLAWSGDYLLRVCGILANLASIDPGGQWGNRPSSSLVSILLPWLPQTTADAGQRHAAVQLIACEQPNVAWELLLELLPTHHSMSTGTHRPKWRDFIPEDWRNEVTHQDRWKDEVFYADLALELAGTDLDRLGELLKYDFQFYPMFDNFSDNYRARLLSTDILALPQEQRFKIWTALETKISSRRKLANDHARSVPEEKLQELQKIAEKLQPDNPMIFHKKIFSNHSHDLYGETGNWDEWLKELLRRRIDALREIRDKFDSSALIAFCRSVDAPGEVGNALASDSELADDSMVFPAMFESGNSCDLNFAASYVWRRFYLCGWGWVDSIDRSTWSIDAKVQFFSSLPFVNEVWERVGAELADKSSEYWKAARAYVDHRNMERIDYAIGQLIENERPDSAIQCIIRGDLWGGEFSKLGLRALEAITNKHHINAHSIGKIFNHLQDDTAVDEERLAGMEMKFLGLADSSDLYPRTLYRRLSEQPDFFCEIIRLIYLPKGEAEIQYEKKIEVDENTKTRIQRAHWLLRGWKHPSPGLQSDGTFTKEGFLKWIDAVKTACTESGHWEYASRKIGEVLFYAPKDESGLWIEPVCKLLNSRNGAGYLRGLAIQIFNSRGAYWFSGGKEEIELAEKWESLALHAEKRGFVRLATSLREMGKGYRNEAEQSVLEHRHGFD